MSKSKIGQRFTRLLVVDVADPYISPKGVKSNRWKCLCDCGNFINLRSCALTTQNNRSCGCLLDESRKRGNPIHGCKGHPLWEIYYAMVRRCFNEKDSEFGDDCKELVGKRIVGTGYWSDSDGLDLYDAWIEEKSEEVVPAWTQVIEHPETVKVTWSKVND